MDVYKLYEKIYAIWNKRLKNLCILISGEDYYANCLSEIIKYLNQD